MTETRTKEVKITAETQALVDAYNTLHKAELEAAGGPSPVFRYVRHARQHVESLCEEHLFAKTVAAQKS